MQFLFVHLFDFILCTVQLQGVLYIICLSDYVFFVHGMLEQLLKRVSFHDYFQNFTPNNI